MRFNNFNLRDIVTTTLESIYEYNYNFKMYCYVSNKLLV